jgi:hypothetical protein
VVIHQVRKLTNLGQTGPGQPAWAAKMAQMRRKTLVVCFTDRPRERPPRPASCLLGASIVTGTS